jgi:hypothetical protein
MNEESDMRARRILTALVALTLMTNGATGARAVDAQPLPPVVAPAAAPAEATDVTPARVSYLHGEVSFWRPGAEDWGPARLNTPLAPGDVFYTRQGGNVEIQIGPRAFVRAGDGAQIGLDSEEPGFTQLRVTAGHAALDLRQLPSGATVELDTPNAAFTIERAGYYHLDVDREATTFRTHRGGSATVMPASAAGFAMPANQQVVVTSTTAPGVFMSAAPPLTAWDRWNSQRTEYLLQFMSGRHVSPAMYGVEALDQYGTWRTVDTYGTVWVPSAVPVGWVPYSTGRWIWDPRFGWTWLDDMPWGWAPYHHGRWVFVGSYWAWAPGPPVARPVYAPALVVFLGGAAPGVERPLCWAPLGWGEPVIPWWGRPGFIGTAWWGGWEGPRVVNTVVIDRTTTVSVTNVTVYQNVHVTNAVLAVPGDRFGRGGGHFTRVSAAEVRQLRAVTGPLEARPVPASVMPAVGPTVRPALQARGVVATRAPQDLTPSLRAHGLATGSAAAPSPPPRIVLPPPSVKTRAGEPPAGPAVISAPAPGTTRPVPRGIEERKSGPSGAGSPQQGEAIGQLKSRMMLRPVPPPAYVPKPAPPRAGAVPAPAAGERSDPRVPRAPSSQ